MWCVKMSPHCHCSLGKFFFFFFEEGEEEGLQDFIYSKTTKDGNSKHFYITAANKILTRKLFLALTLVGGIKEVVSVVLFSFLFSF